MIVDMEIEVFFFSKKLSKQQEANRLIDPEFSFPYTAYEKRLISIHTISHYEPHFDYDDKEYFDNHGRYKEYTLVSTYSGTECVIDMTYSDFKNHISKNKHKNLFNN